MPKSKDEPTKKHGDKMEPLIDKASGDGSRGKRDQGADEDREQVKDQDDE